MEKSKSTTTYMVGDFETTAYDGQEDTQVWASAVVELFTEDVKIFHSIGETFEYYCSLDKNLVVYYHNLKFDGSFWIDYFLRVLNMEQAYKKKNEEGTEVEFIKTKFMKNNTFKYSISELGQWYSITIKIHGHYIEIRDSLKLLPFSVKEIGETFGTKHKKLDMEYTGFRYAGCPITDDERHYIANDVLVPKEALEIMFNDGHNKLTIGACCLQEYKKMQGGNYDYLFPDLTKIEIDSDLYGSRTADEYIRHSYKGGWCYIVKGKENQLKYNGVTADVNSLYPSEMHSESGNYYPVGVPQFFKANNIPKWVTTNISDLYFFVRIKTRFYIKKDKLPFIQIKGSMLYKGTEALESSDVYNKETGKYCTEYKTIDGKIHDTRQTLTLTQTDYKLLCDHYDLVDFELLDICVFQQEIGIFDEYIDKYKQLKMTSKGSKRTEAKLFLNNLYGKLSSSEDSSFKVAYLNEHGNVSFLSVPDKSKKAGFIACGSAITSYARNFTIRTAQENYYGKNERGFIYADTDSIHCDLEPSELKGIKIHPSNFCCWKLESSWDIGLFVRQKTYIEHVTHEDLIPIKKPFYNIKCAGMPSKCKNLFLESMGIDTQEFKNEKLADVEKEFIKKERKITDFKLGLVVPGKLMPKRIRGGVLLMNTFYEMRG